MRPAIWTDSILLNSIEGRDHSGIHGLFIIAQSDLRAFRLLRLSEDFAIEVFSVARLQRTCFDEFECATTVRAPLRAEEDSVQQPLGIRQPVIPIVL
jgi:hypothetical protein